MTSPTENGIYFDIRFADYLKWPFPSQSTLKEGRASPAHVKAAMDRERVKVPTDEMLLGSALHVAFLEPEKLLDSVVKWEGKARRGKEWDAFKDANANKIILTEAMNAKLIRMVQALRRHPRVREWLGKIEHTEVAAIGDVHGLRMKGRCDALTNDPLVDLKKVATCDLGRITNTILTFGYHIQSYIYRTLFNRDKFLLICIEDEPPFDVVPHELSPAFLRMGQSEAESLIERYKECEASGIWPGRCDDVVTVEPPEWSGSGNLTIDGVDAFGDE